MIRLPRYPGSVAARPAAAAPAGIRAGFSLVELLVVMSIMVILMGLVAAAVAGARSSQAKQSTQLLISKLDAIIQQQMATYAARVVPMPSTFPSDFSATTKAAYRSWYIRRNLISGDLPDNWTDVEALGTGLVAVGTPPVVDSGTAIYPRSSAQRTYASIWNQASARSKPPTQQFGDAECLFMIVMQGGIADCIDCGELRTADRGDADGDGFLEFHDSWGNPIGFVLWPAALELPVGTRFFSGSRALEEPFPQRAAGLGAPRPSPALGMRPLIYSGGADRTPSLAASTGNVVTGTACGSPASQLGGLLSDPKNPGDRRQDNITNLDAEALK